MHRFVLCILMLMIMVPAAIQAQVSTFSKKYIDTLKTARPTASLYLGVYLMEDAVQYLYLYGNADALIPDKRNQHEVMAVINYQGLKERSTSNAGYIFAHSNLFRYKTAGGKRVAQKFSLEPFFMYQFDEDRGVNCRLQAGAYAVPVILESPKIRIQAGIGFLYQWDRYDLLPPDYEGWWTDEQWKTISRDIQQLDTKGTGFISKNGVRASVYLGFYSTFGKVFDWNLVLFYQQPFESSFVGTPFYGISADYRTPYPCFTAETSMSFRILPWLALDLRYYWQHDRNQLTFYLPWYMYYSTLGVSFTI